jgi:hypothetical protein
MTCNCALDGRSLLWTGGRPRRAARPTQLQVFGEEQPRLYAKGAASSGAYLRKRRISAVRLISGQSYQSDQVLPKSRATTAPETIAANGGNVAPGEAQPRMKGYQIAAGVYRLLWQQRYTRN